MVVATRQRSQKKGHRSKQRIQSSGSASSANESEGGVGTPRRHRSRARSKSRSNGMNGSSKERSMSISQRKIKRSRSLSRQAAPSLPNSTGNRSPTPSLPSPDIPLSRHFPHAHPVHVTASPSPFSPEAPSQNYRGFFNLSILLLFVNNIRLVIENFLKYGVLLTHPAKYLPQDDVHFAALVIGALACHTALAFLIEKMTLKYVNALIPGEGIFHRIMTILTVLNCFMVAAFPTAIVWHNIGHPVVGFGILSVSVVLCVKLVSYHLVNMEMRTAFVKQNVDEKDGDKPTLYEACQYPKNITFGNLLYFWMAPTLCYQPTYPRSPSIRPFFIFKRLLELVTTMTVTYVLLEQYAIPTVKNSLRPMQDLNFMSFMERLLKLSISSLYIWLLQFYACFHAYFNIVAELLRFGDRSFYYAWWNCKSIGEYWRLWNRPVHNWFKRHMYIPLRSRGLSSGGAQIAIFFVSAVFHEFLVAVPTGVVKFWAFWGMLAQIPLISMTNLLVRKDPNSSIGNYLFWISFCIVGQPMCALLYYRAWAKDNLA